MLKSPLSFVLTFFSLDDMSLLEIEEFLHTASSLLEQAEKCFTVSNNWLNNVIVHSNLGVVHRTWAHAMRYRPYIT